MIRQSAEVVAELVREYSEEAVLRRLGVLGVLYKAELSRVMAELERLLPSYRGYVSRSVHRRAKNELRLMQAHLRVGSLSLQELEVALKYLLKMQFQIVEILKEDRGATSQEHFGLECQATGSVKAYKRMTAAQAYRLNLALAAEDSFCRWTPLVNVPVEREAHYPAQTEPEPGAVCGAKTEFGSEPCGAGLGT